MAKAKSAQEALEVTKLKAARKEVVKFEEDDSRGLLTQLLGIDVAIMAARWQYRGKVSRAMKDGVLLSPCTCVEVSGSGASETPNTEDHTGGWVFIRYDAIEAMYQPNWVFAPYPLADAPKKEEGE